MTRLTALTIVSNYPDNILISSSGPDIEGKFVGWIYLLKNKEIHQPLVSSDSIFNSKDEAETEMHELCKSLKTLTF